MCKCDKCSTMDGVKALVKSKKDMIAKLEQEIADLEKNYPCVVEKENKVVAPYISWGYAQTNIPFVPPTIIYPDSPAVKHVEPLESPTIWCNAYTSERSSNIDGFLTKDK